MSTLSTRDLGITGIALLGTWFVAQSGIGLAGLLAIAVDPESKGPITDVFTPFQVLSIASYGIVGATLIFFRYAIAKSWFPTSVLTEPLTENNLASVLFAVLGVWLMASAIIDLSYSEAFNASLIFDENADIPYSQAWPPRIRAGVGLLIGFGIFVRAEGLAHSWRWLRQARWYREHEPPAT